MKYLVTGAGGFAGRYLVAELGERGHEVVSLVRKSRGGQNEVIADLLDPEAVRKAVADVNPDGIFHLAAPETSVGQSWKDPERTLTDNLATAVAVFGAARAQETPPRVLFVSSAEVYGAVPEAKQPIAEDTPVNPESPYATSKVLGETAARFYFDQGVPVVTVRAFHHIGPGQKAVMVIPNFARQIAAIERAGEGQLKVGNLEARRDFLDVRDMVRAYAEVMEHGTPGETYNAGSGTSRSIKQLLESLVKLSPATIDTVVEQARFRPTDIPVLTADASKLKTLGWEPRIDINQTLSDILGEARDTKE